MGTLRQQFKLTAHSLIAGLILAGLLGGCTEPFVKVTVQVDTCQAGGMGKQFGPPPEIGACMKNNVTSPIDANVWNNNNAWDMVTNTRITDHSHICSSGFICQSSPGSQGCPILSKPCMTKWNNGVCSCGCPP